MIGRILGDWQMDDAYISYRYAWNLWHGQGLVYNPGEIVEGYTNFLWTLFSAIPIGIGVHPASITLGDNIALGIGILGLTYHLATKLSGRAYVWPFIAGALIVTDGSVAAYSARGSGMESALFAFLVLLSAACLWSLHSRQTLVRSCGGVALALASLTRPEGLLVAAVFLGVRVWQDRKQGGKSEAQSLKSSLGLVMPALVPFLIIVVPYQVWRILFYGYPLPNTFYAKTGATLALIERGWTYVAYFLGERWLLVALVIFGAGLALLGRRAVSRSVAHYAPTEANSQHGMLTAFAILLPLYTLYILWAGGDHFPGFRFFVPLVAPLVLLAVDVARRGFRGFVLPNRATSWAGSMLALAVVAYIVSALWLQEPEGVQGQLTRLHTAYVNRWGAAGIWLRDHTPPGTLTAAKGAGAIAFYSERPVLDVYGLNDLHIGHLDVATMGESNPGHDKSDPKYVLDQLPIYILDEWLGYFQPVKGKLKQEYSYVSARAPTGHQIAWWHRR